MSLPEGVAKCECTGFVFIVRTREELRALSDEWLQARFRWVSYHTLQETREDLSFHARNIALAERQSLVNEIDRRRDAAR